MDGNFCGCWIRGGMKRNDKWPKAFHTKQIFPVILALIRFKLGEAESYEVTELNVKKT